MASSYVNDLRLNEMATGDASGTWGDTTNTNLELIAEAFSYGTEAITTNADTHTTTIADGATDPGRSMFLKYTGTLDSTCTITIGPNTVSKLWIIENGTSGSQSIIIKQGSGATVTIPSGKTKVIYSDGAGSGGAMVDAFSSLNLQTSGIIETSASIQTALIEYTDGDDAMTIADGGGVTFAQTATFSDDIIIGDGKTIGSASDVDAMTIASNGQVTFSQTLIGTALDISGDIDVDGTTNLDVVDIDGAVDMASTLAVTGAITGATAAFTQTNTVNSPVSARYNGSNKKVAFNINNSNGQGFIASNSNSVVGSANQTYDITNTAGKIDFGTGITIDTAVSGSAGGTITYVNNADFLPTGIVFNEGGVDADFRVESNNNANMLFVDGGNDRVGIGAAPTARTFEVNSGTTNVVARFESTDSRAALEFKDTAGTAEIGNLGNHLSFLPAGTERMELNDEGGLIVTPTTGGHTVFNEGSVDADFRVESNDHEYKFFVDGGNNRIGVATSSPAADVHIKQIGDIGNGNSQGLMIETGAGSQKFILQTGRAGVSNSYFNLRDVTNTRDIFSVLDTDGKFQGHTPFEWNNAAVFNEGSQDYDFRVESNSQTHMFFVDGGKNCIGIGTSSTFEHNQSSAIDLSYDGTIWAGNTYWAGGLKTGVTFYGQSSGDRYKHSSRNAVQIHQNSQGGNILFNAAAGGTAGDVISWQEIAEFARDEVVFNNGGVDQDFRVESNGNAHMFFVDGGNDQIIIGSSAANDNDSGFFDTNGIYTLSRTSGNGRNMLVFRNGGSGVGTITTSSSATQYNTSSDARLKDVTGKARGLEIINALNPVAYNWKADGKADEGLIAQEVMEIVPNAVSGSEEEMYQMDYSKLVVHLVAGMKEQQAQIEALQSEINLLKGE